jgi:hypothetical protein
VSWWVWLLLIAWGPSVALALLLLVVLSPIVVGLRMHDRAVITRRVVPAQGDGNTHESSSS